MSDDLYNGCPVDVTKHTWPDGIAPRRFARLVEYSLTPGKAWIVAYRYGSPGGGPQRWIGEALLVSADGLRISNSASDPPPLPDWARG
jgi:hypothetical protein